MERGSPKAIVAGIAALALAVSAVGPCECLLDVPACHLEAQQAGSHECCEEPAGLQAASEECCDNSLEMVVAATDVPDVSPPTLQVGPLGQEFPPEQSMLVDAVRTPPTPSLDRTTVLLI